jgi:hypothetical protein
MGGKNILAAAKRKSNPKRVKGLSMRAATWSRMVLKIFGTSQTVIYRQQ